MRLPLDVKAPARKRALEAAAVRLGQPVPHGFRTATPYVGRAARQLLGEVDVAARLPLTREFDGPMLRYLFPPPSHADLRVKVAGIGIWAGHHAGWGYTWGPPRTYGLELPPLTHPLDTDCSAWYDVACRWAGLPASACPMGNGWAHWGNTETLAAHLRQLHAITALQLGDCIIWGRPPATHHVAFVVADAGSSNPLLSSHGRRGGPFLVRFVDEHRAQAGRPAVPYSLF